MYPVNYILFLQIILFLFITPGTPRIVIVSQAVNYGAKKCIWTALGDISANTMQMILVVFVIGGPFGHDPSLRKNAWKVLGFSPLVLNHE